MKNKLGFTDLAFLILFPEIEILQLTISKLGTSRMAKKQMHYIIEGILELSQLKHIEKTERIEIDLNKIFGKYIFT